MESKQTSKSDIKEILQSKHSYQTEFRDAVLEVMDDVINYYDGDSSENILSFFNRLIEPDRTIKFKIEWFDDQNILQVNRGFRVQFNNSIGPYKGGIRFHPTVNESILKFLAFEQIFKNALTGFPMGGAKGGSDFNPKGKSEHEIRRFCQAFMMELYKYIGSNKDIPAGDIGVGTREIGYLYGTYLRLTDNFSGVLTGKHPNFGGSCGREEATGYGCVFFLKNALNEHQIDLTDKRVLVSGAGNVALYTVEKLLEENAKVLTVSDSKGTLYFENGITSKELDDLKELKFTHKQPLKEWKGKNGEYREDEKPWSINADIAMPCATQNEMDANDVKTLIRNGVEAICEGANMPVTGEGVEILKGNKILYLPGKAANAGGVAVSNLELSQNAVRQSSTKSEIENHLSKVMERIYRNCIDNIEKEGGQYNYKAGANLYAFKKVYKSMKDLVG